jgi:multisubunit Na+/H+ antiporter MnhC subunit
MVIEMIVTAVVIGMKCYTGFVIEVLAQIGKEEKLRSSFDKDGS